jgi:hypothetical protein
MTVQLRGPKGLSAPRRGRADYAVAAEARDTARRIKFERLSPYRLEAYSNVGWYILENTCDGPQPWRARRNGSLIMNGMCRTEIDARLAVSADLAKRRAAQATQGDD